MARGDCLLDANFCGRAVGHNDLVTAAEEKSEEKLPIWVFQNNFPIFDLAQPTETRGDILVQIPYWHAALCGTRINIYNHCLVSNSITVAEKNLWETSSRIANFVQCYLYMSLAQMRTMQMLSTHTHTASTLHKCDLQVIRLDHPQMPKHSWPIRWIFAITTAIYHMGPFFTQRVLALLAFVSCSPLPGGLSEPQSTTAGGVEFHMPNPSWGCSCNH